MSSLLHEKADAIVVEQLCGVATLVAMLELTPDDDVSSVRLKAQGIIREAREHLELDTELTRLEFLRQLCTPIFERGLRACEKTNSR